jgi:hypothetical protein
MIGSSDSRDSGSDRVIAMHEVNAQIYFILDLIETLNSNGF